MATVPEVLRLRVPAQPLNSSARITMLAEEVRLPDAPILLLASVKFMIDLSFAVPVPRASITIEEVTAWTVTLSNLIGCISVPELDPEMKTPPVPLFEITVLEASEPKRKETPKVSELLAVDVPYM